MLHQILFALSLTAFSFSSEADLTQADQLEIKNAKDLKLRVTMFDEFRRIEARDLDAAEAVFMAEAFWSAIKLDGDELNSLVFELSDEVSLDSLQRSIKLYRIDKTVDPDDWKSVSMYLDTSSVAGDLPGTRLYRISRGQGERKNFVYVSGRSPYNFSSGWYVLHISADLESESGKKLGSPRLMAFEVKG